MASWCKVLGPIQVIFLVCPFHRISLGLLASLLILLFYSTYAKVAGLMKHLLIKAAAFVTLLYVCTKLTLVLGNLLT